MTTTDINQWNLTIRPGVSVDFGLHDTGYPFTKQVAIGPVEFETGDQPHPLTDGTMFGVDMARGRTIGFAGALLADLAQPRARRWDRPLDASDHLEGVWHDETLRRTLGAVATLTNVDRGRFVVGRPRGYASDLEVVRHGWATWTADFKTTDHLFYGVDEQSVSAHVANAPRRGFRLSGTPSGFTSAGSLAVNQAVAVSAGTAPAWPTIFFVGPIVNPTVSAYTLGGGLLWTLTMAATLTPAQVGYIDTRPWARTVTLGSKNVPGALRGTQLNRCRIPPGSTRIEVSGTDATGTGTCYVAWHDAYSGL